ncbi:MAG: DNA internalization-related competence protein ComEC/Rec2 [Pseudomonadota bacterium]|nr:DNA internalization-related competence protein ComEC/Rec2 [Pseudomonadota bacterium]
MPPLVALALGSALGSALYPALQPPLTPLIVAIVALLGLAGGAGRRGAGRVGRVALAAAGFALGMAGPAALPDPPRLVGEWRARGRVVTAAWGAEADVALTALARPSEAWVPAEGRVRVRFPGTPPPPGAAVLVGGKARLLDPGALPGAPDPVWEAARAGVVSGLTAREAVRIGPPPPTFELGAATHAGLLRAMLDGDRSGVPADVADRMRRTGTWHLVSISGLHIGLCATVAWAVAWVLTRPLVIVWRHGGLRWLCAAAAIGAAVAYADVAGWPLPARRAVWMSAAGAVVAALRARPGVAEVLALAWLGTTAAEPGAVANAGAQLSFSAMIGMALVGPRVTRWLPPDSPWWVRWPVGALATTAGATAGTLPTVAWYFQDLAPTAPIANLLAVPLMGTVATPALLLSQVLPGPLGALALWVADGCITLGLAALAPLDVAPIHPAVGLPGALLLAAAVLLRRHLIAATLLIVLALGLVERPSGVLVVRFLDVGQGDAALIQWPDGRAWLVDGGPPGEDVLLALRRWGIHRLDTVVLTHPHPDHIGGLDALLRELPVGTIRVPRLPLPGEDAYITLLAHTRARRVIGAWGAEAAGSVGGAGYAFLHPGVTFAPDGNVNDESLVLRVGFGARRFLFTGDIEAAGEAALAGADVRADVLKVPHHGSRTSSSQAFIDAVNPAIAVMGVGRDNRYGHPHAEVMGRYRGRDVLRTDRDGTVEVRTDGRSLEVRRFPPETWRLRGVPVAGG